jgi:flagellar biosynthesis/type III secretory pathway M-ring protein FliF/YscJ
MLSMENHIQDMRVDVAATSRGSAETRILLILILVILVAGVAAFAAWSATS